jgi:hypothetical protein
MGCISSDLLVNHPDEWDQIMVNSSIYNPFHSGLGLKQDLVASPVAADQKCGTMLRTMYVKFGLREKFGVTCSLISNSNIASRISNILKPSLT